MSVQPFSSGSEYEAWRLTNCALCKKQTTEDEAYGSRLGLPLRCDLDQALLVSYWESGDVSDEIAKRLGRPGGARCGELEPAGEREG
jgi:hypothetical protein